MKAVMISIQPKWVEKIVSGEKTIEVRKTAPKIETPLKCYIYATKGGDRIVLKNDRIYELSKSLTGVVVGEFVCDRIHEWTYNYKFGEYNTGGDSLRRTCLSHDELENYGKGKTLYGWHISDLKIYDKPKEISKFWSVCGNKMGAIQRPPRSWCYVEELKEKE